MFKIGDVVKYKYQGASFQRRVVTIEDNCYGMSMWLYADGKTVTMRLNFTEAHNKLEVDVEFMNREKIKKALGL